VERIAKGVPIGVEATLPWLGPVASGLAASGLTAVETYGKASVLRFGDGRGLYVHLQLYGRWRFGRAAPRTGRALRLALHGPSSSARLYSATDVALLDDGEVHPFVAGLGPDPLHPGTDAAVLAASLARSPRKALGAVLLDQQRIAGLGNYLRAEVLWEAQIAPRRTWASLDRYERDLLLDAIREVPRRSLLSGGRTVPEPFATELRVAGVSRRASRHAVYGRADEPCPRCGARVTRDETGGRAMFACPDCQR
jgi:endonuclease VIII